MDEQLKKDWAEAADQGTELLEQEAYRRAYHGTLEPVFFKGELCGHVRRYSDNLMMFLLKARKPELYRDMQEQGKAGSTVNVSVQTNMAALEVLRKLVMEGSAVSALEFDDLGVKGVTSGAISSLRHGPLEVTSTPGSGGQSGEVDSGASLGEDKFSSSGSVENS